MSFSKQDEATVQLADLKAFMQARADEIAQLKEERDHWHQQYDQLLTLPESDRREFLRYREFREARAETARWRVLIEIMVGKAQMQYSGELMIALGFDVVADSRWRWGFHGWERQADEAQAGYFPATDWLDDLLTPSNAAPERRTATPRERH